MKHDVGRRCVRVVSNSLRLGSEFEVYREWRGGCSGVVTVEVLNVVSWMYWVGDFGDLVTFGDFPHANEIARAMGIEIFGNVKEACNSLHAAAQDFRQHHAVSCKPHNYCVGQQVLLSTENINLKIPCKKLAPRFVGPFRFTDLNGHNAVQMPLVLSCCPLPSASNTCGPTVYDLRT